VEQNGHLLLFAGATTADVARLRTGGTAVAVLDPDMQGGRYYLGHVRPNQEEPDWRSFGRPLLRGSDWVLMRTESDVAGLGLEGTGIALQAMTLDPKPLGTAIRAGAFPAVVTPEPPILEMMDQVDSTDLYSDTGGLSGEWPVQIGGFSYTIGTRHTYSQVPVQRAVEYVGQRMEGMGLAVEYHHWSSGLPPNVVGELTGSVAPEDVYILCGHLDDMPPGALAPGADDNASGSIAVLVAAEILAQYRWGSTLRFALWTGEEQGLLGSQAYAARAYSRGERILGVLNLDMIGYNTVGTDPGIDLHARSSIPASLELAQLFQDVVSVYDLDLQPEITADGTGASDHASFWQYGYAAILGIEDMGDFNPRYHTVNDRLEHLDLAYMTSFVRAAVGTFAHMCDCLLPVATGVLAGQVRAEDGSAPIGEAQIDVRDGQGAPFPAVADADGYYSRTLTVGQYSLTASAFGYLPATAQNILVMTDTVTTVDLNLATAPSHTISGSVTNTANGRPLGAIVEALDTPLLPVPTDPATGSYSLTLPAGVYTLRARANGFRPVSRLLVVDQEQVQDFPLDSLPCILLVDDDRDVPDVRGYYAGALEFLETEFQVWDTSAAGDPAADDLLGYPMVLWFTGAYSSGAFTGFNESQVAEYLNAGGSFFLSSQNYLGTAGPTPFGREYLHIGAVTLDQLHATVTGQGPYAGLGPFDLRYPFTNQSDQIYPDGGGLVAFVGDHGGAGIAHVGDVPTVFLSFPVEAIPGHASREAVMRATVVHLGGCPARHGWLGGRVNDAVSGEPVVGATVTAAESLRAGAHTLTDAQGHYSLTLAAATYDISLFLLGYASEIITDVVVVEGMTTTLDLVLTPVPVLRSQPDLFDLALLPGQAVTRSLTVTNSGRADLVFSAQVQLGRADAPKVSGDVEDGWIGITPAHGTVVPGAGATLVVVLDAAGLAPGRYDALVVLETNDPQASRLEVPVGLLVQPACQPIEIHSVVALADGCSASFVPEYAGDSPVRWRWEFEDGSPATSSAAQPERIDFGMRGTYAYTVTATNCADANAATFRNLVSLDCCVALDAVELEWQPAGPMNVGQEVMVSVHLMPVDTTPPFQYRVTVDSTAGSVLTSTVISWTFPVTFGIAGGHSVRIDVWNCTGLEPVTDTQWIMVRSPQAFLPVMRLDGGPAALPVQSSVSPGSPSAISQSARPIMPATSRAISRALIGESGSASWQRR
jgi:hypothetical protein